MARPKVSATDVRALTAGLAAPVGFLVYGGDEALPVVTVYGAAFCLVLVVLSSAWWPGGPGPDDDRWAGFWFFSAFTGAQAVGMVLGQAWGPPGVRVVALGASAMAALTAALRIRRGLAPVARVDLPAGALVAAVAAIRFPSAPAVALAYTCYVQVVAAGTRALIVPARPRLPGTWTFALAVAVPLSWWWMSSLIPFLDTGRRLEIAVEAALALGLAIIGVASALIAWSRLAPWESLWSAWVAPVRTGFVFAPVLLGGVVGALFASGSVQTAGGVTGCSLALASLLDEASRAGPGQAPVDPPPAPQRTSSVSEEDR